MTEPAIPIEDNISKARRAHLLKLSLETPPALSVAQNIREVDAFGAINLAAPIGSIKENQINKEAVVEVEEPEIPNNPTVELRDRMLNAKHSRPNKAANSVYYSRENGEIFADLFKEIFENPTIAGKFIDSRVMGCSPNTLYMRAQYALKWLSEKHPEIEQRNYWRSVRVGVSIKKELNPVKPGILLMHKIKLMILAEAGKLDKRIAKKANIASVLIKDYIKEEAEKLVQNEKTTQRQWKGEFFTWCQSAEVGEVFTFTPQTDEQGNAYKFTSEDETWLLEMATNGLTFSDYKFDWERNMVTVMK